MPFDNCFGIHKTELECPTVKKIHPLKLLYVTQDKDNVLPTS